MTCLSQVGFVLVPFLASCIRVQGVLYYPSIQWDHRNTIFQTNYSISVLRRSKLIIVCPNPATIPVLVRDSTPMEEMFENLWIVDKPSYDACAVDTSQPQNRIAMKCDTPLELRYYTVVFQRFSANPDGLEFEPGKNYYFIATSSGKHSSLNETSGGRCSTHNMKMKIYVCVDSNDPRCSTSPMSTLKPTNTIALHTTNSQSDSVHISPTTVTQQPYCSASPVNHYEQLSLSEITNNTNLIPEILNHTSQLVGLWAQLRIMTDKLDKIQDELDNCSHEARYGHLTAATPSTAPPILYADCKELFNAGYRVSGVYDIKPPGSNESFPVYCDQQTAIKGWTVIQKRFNGSVIFSNRTWAEYRNGFGSLTGEFWLGLDKIHILTKTPTRIRFDLGTPDGVNRFAAYQGFTITGEDDKYRLTTGRFIAGNCGNSFSSANGKRFSTVDQDNDNSPKSCAQKFKSGWWHGRCHQSSLNGLYFLGSSSDPYHFASGITWYTWKGYSYSLSKSEMKIRIW